jgi:hypothetical protein
MCLGSHLQHQFLTHAFPSLKSPSFFFSLFSPTKTLRSQHYSILNALEKNNLSSLSFASIIYLCNCGIVCSILFFSFFFYYSYVHTRLGSFLPPATTPSLTTHSTPSRSPPSIPRRNYFALISNFVVERV